MTKKQKKTVGCKGENGIFLWKDTFQEANQG